MGVKITQRLLEIHLSFFEKSNRVSAGDVQADLGWLTPYLERWGLHTVLRAKP